MKKVILPVSFIALEILGGCASQYQESFDCPAVAGVGCASISQVNKMVDEEKITSDEDTEASTPSEKHSVSSRGIGRAWFAPYRKSSNTWQGPQMIAVALPDDRDVEDLYSVRPRAEPSRTPEAEPLPLDEKPQSCATCSSGDAL